MLARQHGAICPAALARAAPGRRVGAEGWPRASAALDFCKAPVATGGFFCDGGQVKFWNVAFLFEEDGDDEDGEDAGGERPAAPHTVDRETFCF